MSPMIGNLLAALILCGALASAGGVFGTQAEPLPDRSPAPLDLPTAATDAELLFRARYLGAHATAPNSSHCVAQPYDLCQACIVQCGGADIASERCMAPCALACGLDVAANVSARAAGTTDMTTGAALQQAER